ncbi:MFS transporter [Promicromonospora xylanilytica]
MVLVTLSAVVLLGLNMRVGVVSASALFHDLQQLLGYGPLVAATLPAIPVVCFAVAGAATTWLTRLVGLERAIGIALVLLTAGLAVRIVDSVGMLLLGTVVSMSGLAICNVAMPSFVRKHFAHRMSAMTAVYTITMSLGATLAAALSVPLAMQLSSPVAGLASWSLLALVALVVFVPLVVARRPRPVAATGPGVAPWPLLLTRRGLLITALFTVQALLAYTLMSWLPSILISRGLEPAAAGLMLGVAQLVSIPAIALVLPMASSPHRQRPAFMVATGASLLGYAALLFLPSSLALVPVLLLGVGFTVFPLVMVAISRSGENAADAAAMSTLAQSVGYLVAAVGPFGLGLLSSATGTWTAPMWLILAAAVLQLVLAYWLSAGAGNPGSGRRHRPQPGGTTSSAARPAR